MSITNPFEKVLQTFAVGNKKLGKYYSLPALQKSGFTSISKLPLSIRVVLESVVRNCDEEKITSKHVTQLANWKPNGKRKNEIPFVVSRIVLQDFTGVPLLADLAAMRGVATKMGKNPKIVEPRVPVDLVVDHSVQVDEYGNKDSLEQNMKLEFQRNEERYRFMKWGMQAFESFKVVPPGVGIVHQVNLEYLARGIHQKGKVFYPDSLVGTDSHTTMINGIGVVGWGVGGIEAEAGMLGQPVYFLTPDVIGVNLTGQLRWGVTATDLVLTLTEMLRKAKVVGKFVEFFGDGTEKLTVPDRATIANMAPEYGATMGFFPVDKNTIKFMSDTGRSKEEVNRLESYFKAQEMFGVPKLGDIKYTKQLTLDLSTIEPSLAGPKRPQDRIPLGKLKESFVDIVQKPIKHGGFNKASASIHEKKSVASKPNLSLGHGNILIAAITSCTNTSNPSVLVAAGILAKKAVKRGLKVPDYVKTSLAPGSRVVTDYLREAGLLTYLEKLGFYVSAYGCTTCIGNSGPLDKNIEATVVENELVCSAVLSGNRNFEARIHGNIKTNYLASPPLVVALAISGTVHKDLMTEPIGLGSDGKPVFIGDIWPSKGEVTSAMKFAKNPKVFQKLYNNLDKSSDLWNQVSSTKGETYNWPDSTYIAEPPFFKEFSLQTKATSNIKKARALAIFGNSLTTDHISPAGAIKQSAPAGRFLNDHGIEAANFNSYGSRRGNHDVMLRGTFANVRIKNLMIPPLPSGELVEGGLTILYPQNLQMPIFDAAMEYTKRETPTIVFGGEEYGTGSSRDWAAKGTQLLGVKAVIAKSFERIHRSNLVGMGVLPLQFMENDSTESLEIKGNETFDFEGLMNLYPQKITELKINRSDGTSTKVQLLLRIDTSIEVKYFLNGGILPYVLRDLLIAA